MIPTKTAIYVASQPVDMRRSFDGLAALASETLSSDPQSGALFLFFGRRRDRLKILWWDRTGFCLLYKRLERGLFRLPGPMRPGDTSVSISAAELARILEGVDLPAAKIG
jgi:transposase